MMKHTYLKKKISLSVLVFGIAFLIQLNATAQYATYGPVAQSLQTSMHSKFISSDGNYYLQDNAGNTGFNYWWNANGIDALLDGYQRTRDNTYLTRMKNLLRGMKIKNGNTYINHFYDDMEWMAISCLRVYQVTGDTEYLDVANLLWTDIKTGQHSERGGAIQWNKSAPNSFNSCANAPAVIFAARMYRVSGNANDLQVAKNIYAWMKANLVDPLNGAVWDSYDAGTNVTNKSWIFSYNVGTFIGAGLELYKITGDATYLNDAIRSAEYAMTNRLYNGVFFTNENGGGDGGLFKGIFIRYFTLLAREGGLPQATKDRYYNAVSTSANALNTQGINTSNMLVASNWTTKPGATTDYATQLSGVMLMEAAATIDVVFCYQDITYGGYEASLPVGGYSLAALQARGVRDNDVTSVVVPTGYQITFFENDNYTGASITYTATSGWVGSWNDKMSSAIIAPVTNIAAGVYTISNQLSGRLLDVSGGPTATGEGAQVITWTSTNGNNQKWKITKTADGFYTFQAAHSYKMLEVPACATATGTYLQQATAADNDCQKFLIVDAGNGYYRFIAKSSYKSVDGSVSTTDGARVYLWDNADVSNHKWKLTASTAAPMVELTSPANNSSSIAPATISLAANAGDLDGSITKVEFYNGATLLNTDNTAPYQFNWTNVAAGTYSITAKAYDNAGQVSTTAVSTVTVTGTAVKVYKDCNYSGTMVSLMPGDYTLSQLTAKGILDNDISSLELSAGYEAVLYDGDNFTGTSIIIKASDNCLVDNTFNDKITSLKIRTLTNTTFTTLIQAENYSSMLGIQTETTTDTDGGLNVGWIDLNDWMAYNNITFPVSGTYKIEYRVASLNGGASLTADLNTGAIVFPSVAIPSTGGWQNWTTVSQNINVTSGTYTLRTFSTVGGWNLNWIRITYVGSSSRLAYDENDRGTTTNATANVSALDLYPNPADQQLNLMSYYELGAGQLRIVDVNGLEVYRGAGAARLDISALSAGLYVLIFTDEQGQQHTQRFVKR